MQNLEQPPQIVVGFVKRRTHNKEACLLLLGASGGDDSVLARQILPWAKSLGFRLSLGVLHSSKKIYKTTMTRNPEPSLLYVRFLLSGFRRFGTSVQAHRLCGLRSSGFTVWMRRPLGIVLRRLEVLGRTCFFNVHNSYTCHNQNIYT